MNIIQSSNHPIIQATNSYNARKVHTDLNWENAWPLKSFIYPWSAEIPPELTFRALWDEMRFYFRFDVEATDVLTYVNTNYKMEVVHSDRVEIFFRSDEKLDPYYCLEMDPLGRVLDYRTRYYRQFEYDWQWPGTGQLEVKAAMTGSGYCVEGSITLQSLKQLNLLQNNELQAGLFRGECLKLPDPGSSFTWISWVRPESQHPDFHIPSAFGNIKLVTGDSQINNHRLFEQ